MPEEKENLLPPSAKEMDELRRLVESVRKDHAEDKGLISKLMTKIDLLEKSIADADADIPSEEDDGDLL